MGFDNEKAERQLLSSLGEFRRQIAFYARVVNDERTLKHRPDDSFFPVDFKELWLLLELHRQAEEGLVSLHDRYPMQAMPAESGPLRSLKDRPVLSLLDYCRLMMIFGDGNAARMIQSVLWETDSRKRLKVAERKHPYSRCYSTARQVAVVFEKLARGELISSRASKGIIGMMSQMPRKGFESIENRLPRGAVATHFVSTNFRVEADVVFFSCERRSLVISVFSDGFESGGPPYGLLQDMVKQILDWGRLQEC